VSNAVEKTTSSGSTHSAATARLAVTTAGGAEGPRRWRAT